MHTQDMAMPKDMYPTLTVQQNKTPNKFWAIPVVGILLKVVILIPVFIEIILVGVAVLVTVFAINPFVVLFTGSYWKTAYSLINSFINLSIKASLFIYGVTDMYPGFSLEPNDAFTVSIKMPTKPNKLFAIPLVGLVARLVLLIPYFIFGQVVNYAGVVAFVGSWVPVLFNGNYPETTYELVRDHQRVSIATFMYMVGLSDTYPTFWISMNHKNIKIALLIAGALIFIMNSVNKHEERQNRMNNRIPYRSAPASTDNTY